MLGILFATLMAQPVSLRRLGLFFVLALVSSAGMLDVLRTRHALSGALITASTLTLLIWGLPLVRTILDSVRARRLSLDGLLHVSVVVQWTYGITLAGIPMFVGGALFRSLHHLALGELTRLLIGAAIAGLIAPILFASMGQRRGPLIDRGNCRRRPPYDTIWGIQAEKTSFVRRGCGR